MKTLREKAYAKLNISLDVISKRSDGYHDMRMVMQSISLCDDITVSLRDDNAINVSTNGHQVLEVAERALHQPHLQPFGAALRVAGLEADDEERAAIADFLGAAVIGGPARIRDGLTALQQATGADEMMFVCDIFDPALRLRSLDIATAVCRGE